MANSARTNVSQAKKEKQGQMFHERTWKNVSLTNIINTPWSSAKIGSVTSGNWLKIKCCYKLPSTAIWNDDEKI